MAQVIFYLEKERAKGCLISVTLTFNNHRLRFSTGLNIPKTAWDAEGQKGKPLKDYADTNKKIRDINNFLLDTYDRLFPKGEKPSKEEVLVKAKEIREAYFVYQGKKETPALKRNPTLTEYIQVFKDRYKNKFSLEHLNHYNSVKSHIEIFENTNGLKIEFESVNKEFYLKFTDYLKSKGLKVNTIGSHIKRIKRLMNEAIEDGLTSNHEHRSKGFKILVEDSDTIFLNKHEIDALTTLKIDDERMSRVRDLFIMNCYTGLRHSDWHKVTMNNINDGKLFVKTQKTNEPVIIPVHPLVLKILDTYGPSLYIPTNQEANRVLRWIGEYAVIKKITQGNLDKWLQIRTHTARRSFATNAYLAGIPMRDIMQITGHRTTESFLKYIRVTKLETAEKLKDHPFFQ